MAHETSIPIRKGKIPTLVWEHTAIHGGVKGHTEYSMLIHVVKVEDAVAIIRQGEIIPYPERERDNALYCKPIEATWFSPKSYPYSVFGNVAFYFDWSVLYKKYGKRVYGLQEVEGRGKERRPTWKSRILFSDEDLPDHIGEPYDIAADDIPWKTHEGRHFLKSH